MAAKKINYNFNFIILLNQTNESVAGNVVNFSTVLEKKIDIEETKIFFRGINKSLTRKDPACIIYTSGTQGTPKGVVFPQYQFFFLKQ